MAMVSSAYRVQVLEEIEKIPDEYLSPLLKIIRVFHESIMLNPAEESFRQGWQEMLHGDTRPISELWEDIDAQ